MDHEGQPAGAGWKYGWGKEQILDFGSHDKRDLTPDELNAEWAAKTLKRFAEDASAQPLFLAVDLSDRIHQFMCLKSISTASP